MPETEAVSYLALLEPVTTPAKPISTPESGVRRVTSLRQKRSG
ncbi:hypothetical protein [Chitinibacter sp. S2-10]